MKLFFQPLFFRMIFLATRITASVPVIAACLLPYPFRILQLIPAQFFSITMPLVCRQHRIETNCSAHLILIIRMASHGDIDRNLDLNTVFLRIQLNPKLALILIIIRQRYINSLPFLLNGNTDPMICITVSPFRYREYVRRIRVQFHMILSHLPA